MTITMPIVRHVGSVLQVRARLAAAVVAAAGLAVTALGATSDTAEAFEIYDVTGVKPGDTLNVRSGGDPSAAENGEIVARLAHDAKGLAATGLSVVIDGQRWHEIATGGVTGFVSGKFIEAAAPNEQRTEPSGVAFQCSGTEPFWGISLSAEGAEMSDMSAGEEKQRLTVSAVVPAAGRWQPLQYSLRRGDGSELRAIVSWRQWCSDGMSDNDYAFDVILSGPDSVKAGCCTIRR